MTSVSIIIPAWNEAKVLKATLEALLEIDYDKTQCEVIVVAGGDDGTYELAQQLIMDIEAFARCVVIPQSGLGTKNAAIQQGLREANNEIIVLLDADTVVSQHWLRSMIHPIEQGSCSLTIANSKPARRNWISDYFMIHKAYSMDRITTQPGHSIAFRANIVGDDIDYFFDKTIWMGDDYVFQKRVSAQGHKTMFIRDAHVITHYPSSLRYFLETEFRWLMAFIHMNGASYKTLMYNTIVLGALISLIPFSRTSFMLSLLFNSLYVAKRARIFLVSSRQYKTRLKRIFGFIILSYAVHIIYLLSYMWNLLGLRKDTYYKGQRN